MPATPLCILLALLASEPAPRGTTPARKGPAGESRKASAKHSATGASGAASPAAKPHATGSASARAPSTTRKPDPRQASRTTRAAKPRQPSARDDGDLERARALLRAVKQDPVRRKYKHEWEKAIVALERAAKGEDRGAALLDAARARYALYRFSSDEADRDRAMALARKSSSAGCRDAATFIAAVRREAGDDAASRSAVATRPAAAPPKRSPDPVRPARPETPEPPVQRQRISPAAAPEGDEPPDTDPVLDRILAQLAEDPAEDRAPSHGAPANLRRSDGGARDAATAPPDLAEDAPAARVAPVDGSAASAPDVSPAVAAPAPAPSGDKHPSRPPAPAEALARAFEGSALPPVAAGEYGDRGPIRKIVIDPGHGGHDTGAIGPTRVREKDVVLSIAKRLARKLEAEGYEVVLTRDDDRFLALAERTALANAHQGDLFVSVHANAHPRRDREGVETWVLDVSSDRYASRLAARENGIVADADAALDVRRILADLDAKVSAQASRRLAMTVQREVTAGVRQRVGPVRDLGVKSALFYVLLGAHMPAVLVETAFISNRAEERRLASGKFQEEVASALVRAIDTFAAQQQRIAAR